MENVTRDTLVSARNSLLTQTVSFFEEQPDVLGIVLSGSLPAGSADAYSDIDLRVIATPDGQKRLVAGRLEWPASWGELLFNEWLEGAQHCVSHFKPFLKIDVFYLDPTTYRASPWLKMPSHVFLDRAGVVRDVLQESVSLLFPEPDPREVSRILSKALAAAHETIRRTRRGELMYAQSLLEELRLFMERLDIWCGASQPAHPSDLKAERRLSPTLRTALEGSYVPLRPDAIEQATVDLADILVRRIPELHSRFSLSRPIDRDVHAAELVRQRAVQ